MDKLESMQAFIAVARAGGFSAAARALGQPLPTVSRKVAELEAALEARLFQRSTRQVVLTESGEAYYQACQRVLEDLRDADERVSNASRLPRGELAVTAPLGFGRLHLQPVATEFLRLHPDITLKLALADRLVNLMEEQIDLAVRISELRDSSLVARKVGSIRMVVCAAPDYLARCGTPGHPRELAQHDCVSWTSLGPFKSWLLHEGDADRMFPIRVRVATTTPESALEAAQAGLGLAQVTSYQAASAVAAGTLVPLLSAFECAPTPVSLVYPGTRHVPLKLRAFLDFAAPRLATRLKAVEQSLAQAARR